MISYGPHVTSSQRACADSAASALRFNATADTVSAISAVNRAIGAAVMDSGANEDEDEEASGRVHDEDADGEEEDEATDIDEEDDGGGEEEEDGEDEEDADEDAEESDSTVWHCRRRCRLTISECASATASTNSAQCSAVAKHAHSSKSEATRLMSSQS